MHHLISLFNFVINFFKLFRFGAVGELWDIYENETHKRVENATRQRQYGLNKATNKALE